MRFKSVSSVQADSCRAGAEIGAALQAIAPEELLLFALIRYERDFADRSDADVTFAVCTFGGSG